MGNAHGFLVDTLDSRFIVSDGVLLIKVKAAMRVLGKTVLLQIISRLYRSAAQWRIQGQRATRRQRI
jgi:hypothetical protein